MFLGVTADLIGYVNEGYGYVCTCLVDANGIKEMLGADAESNDTFSSCSESGAQASKDGDDKKAADDAKKAEANRIALWNMAKNKKISDTAALMTGTTSCNLRTSS